MKANTGARSEQLLTLRKRAIQLLLGCFLVTGIGFFFMYNYGEQVKPRTQSVVIYVIFAAVVIGLLCTVVAVALPAINALRNTSDGKR